MLGDAIAEDHFPSVLENNSNGKCRRLYGAREYNTQLGISATGNKGARVYRGAFPQSFPEVDPRKSMI